VAIFNEACHYLSMTTAELWTGVATATGVPGLGLLAVTVVYSHLTKSIPGMTKEHNFILRNRMLFVFAGVVLLCVCAGAIAGRIKSGNDCSNSTYSTFGDDSPNQPCNSGTINNNPAKKEKP
jgi:hypothetical protein